MKRAIWIIIIIGLIVIQFIRPDKNLSDEPAPAAITNHYKVPSAVQSILKTACYDCHSNNTVYPWYFKTQPFAWFMAGHIRKGKKHLNFDEFYNYPLKRQDHKLHELIEMLQKDKMPLKSYRLIHTDARLTEGQKQKVIDWARELQKQFILSKEG